MFHWQCLLSDGTSVWLEEKLAHVKAFHEGKMIVAVGVKMDSNDLMKYICGDGVMGERFIPALC
jgi:hypothetical protein